MAPSGMKSMWRGHGQCLALFGLIYACLMPTLSWAEEMLEQGTSQFQWIEDAIEIAPFVEDNQLVMREDSYDKYEARIVTLPHDEKLAHLYEVLVDAMFTSRSDLTDRFMPLYVETIEATASDEHRQAVEILETAQTFYSS